MIKDFYCKKCGAIKENIQVSSCEISSLSMPCDCGGSAWESCCNGGIKSRYRFNDWGDPRDIERNHISYHGAGAADMGSDGESPTNIRDQQGNIIGNKPKYSQSEAQRRYHDYLDRRDHARGHGKISITQRATSAL